MKRFFTKTGIWLLAAAATIAVVLCVVSALSSGTGLLRNALGVIASPFRAAGSAVAGWVGGISQRFEDVETLQQENDELRQQIAELEEQLRQMEPAATENKELRQLLGLRQQRSDLVFEAARVTQRDVSNWASTLVLDRGQRAVSTPGISTRWAASRPPRSLRPHRPLAGPAAAATPATRASSVPNAASPGPKPRLSGCAAAVQITAANSALSAASPLGPERGLTHG